MAPVVRECWNRIVHAVKLYHAEVSPILIPTGRTIKGMGPDRDLSKEAGTLMNWLGVPELWPLWA